MSKREVPKMNKENFTLWKSGMRLYLSRIGDNSSHYLDNQQTPPNPPMTNDEIIQKKEHNNLMIEIASSLINVDFDDVKDFFYF